MLKSGVGSVTSDQDAIIIFFYSETAGRMLTLGLSLDRHRVDYEGDLK